MSNDLQRTEEWYAQRCGKVTASMVFDVCDRGAKGQTLKACEDYKMQLALERLTGKPEDSFTNAAMQWGIDTEPLAKEAYTLQTMQEVQDVGFLDHPTIPNFGASPDGLLMDMFGKPLNKAIEIKCPTSKTHLDSLVSKKINPRYIYQMAAQLMCLGLTECVFLSFDPRFPVDKQMFIKEFSLTKELEEEITFNVVKFNSEVDQVIGNLEAA
ncbi:YqaJ viral recombinase family protein [Ignatzschineria rhizosphaerae]|uniref:YqaJ viral recombinase family protein n=1 Tax=Ignatzschineria rhizosphaerae TaxID=2923279 RepID=A0ABY3WZ73_9GAMM|nr:lambda exonuclease family protein [Ignatzschineria rhizosphaerae]UNM95909.1 YqaJ viral recombinase family protein [Ignatzschineria rhizosphaerae]